MSREASPYEKDAETMVTQKLFKRRVRSRMTKTGESYTAARSQLLRKGVAPEPEAAAPEPPASPPELLTSDEAMRKATGKGHDEWFAILDAWGATDHTHTEIARWVNVEHGVPGWWSQNITVNYERARGMRAANQVVGGFQVAVSKTLDAGPERVLSAFTDTATRSAWLPEPLIARPTKARLAARFDWPEPASRVVVSVAPKGEGRAVVTVGHERLPDGAAVERFRALWRERLAALKTYIE